MTCAESQVFACPLVAFSAEPLLNRKLNVDFLSYLDLRPYVQGMLLAMRGRVSLQTVIMLTSDLAGLATAYPYASSFLPSLCLHKAACAIQTSWTGHRHLGRFQLAHLSLTSTAQII